MKNRRSLTNKEQISTLTDWMAEKKMNQSEFAAWITTQGITLSPQYLNDVLNSRRHPGPKFKEIFKQITGITLVDGLVESEEK
jgi:hypothetical protein